MITSRRVRQIVAVPPGEWVIHSSTAPDSRGREWPDGQELWALPVTLYAMVETSYDDETTEGAAYPMTRDLQSGTDYQSPTCAVVTVVEVVTATSEQDALRRCAKHTHRWTVR